MERLQQYMMQQILKISKTSLLIEEAFCLVESLILIAPLERLEYNLEILYKLIEKHYHKLKK